ncbi:MAG: hypothetical protein WBC06_12590 [Chitinophagaceae bacterium]
MKKISTLVLAGLFTMAAFAADRRPSVTVRANDNYEIVIDGRSYFNSNYGVLNITNLRGGRHTITVYEADRGRFSRRFKRVVASTSFILRGNDISILIDRNGRMMVKESRNQRGWDNNGRDRDDNDRGYNDYDNGYNNGNDQDDRGKKDKNDNNDKREQNKRF